MSEMTFDTSKYTILPDNRPAAVRERKMLKVISDLADAHIRICKGSCYEIGWESDGKDFGVSNAILKKHADVIQQARKATDGENVK